MRESVVPGLFRLPLLLVFTVLNAEIILISYEEGDYYATSIVEHLNISSMFFKDKTGAFLIPKEQVITASTSTDNLCDEITNASIIISLARSNDKILMMMQVAALSRIPVVQIAFSPWTVNNSSTLSPPSDTPNYISLVLPSLVFQYSLLDIFPLMGVSSDLVVLRDDVYSRGFNSWRYYFNSLPVNVTYKNLALTPDKIRLQIKNILSAEKMRMIAFVAETANIQQFMLEAQQFIATGQLQMFAMTKDVTAFSCDSCMAADMFWIRPYSTNTVQDIREYNDFIIQNEIKSELKYWIRPWDEMDVSFFYDIMNATARYIKAVNSTYGTVGYAAFNCIVNTENTSLPILPFFLARKVNEYGELVQQGPNAFYENVPVRVFRIWNNASDAEDRYAKLMANWTATTGVQLYYDKLTTMPFDIKFYRIVTIVQPPFVQLESDGSFSGYCIDMMTMIADNLNLTDSYVIFEVEDGTFGTIDENGNWNGLMGALVSGSADMALAPLSVTSEREIDVDFTVPYYNLVGTTILMKKQDTPYSLFRFLDVFIMHSMH